VLLQQRSLPQGAVLQEQAAPAWVPCRVTSPAANLLQNRLLSPWVHGSWQEGGLSTGSQPPSGIHLLWPGVLHELQVDICSTVDLHELQRDSLLHHGVHHGLEGNICFNVWSTSSPSSSLTSAELFLSCVLAPLSSCSCQCAWVFFPHFLKKIIPEVLQPSPMGSALASGESILEPGGIGLVIHWGCF